MRDPFLLAGLLVMGLWVGSADANDPLLLADPTRPPQALLPKTTLPGPANAMAAASGASAPDKTAPAAARMQLSLIRIDANTGRGVALIDEQLVSVGDRVGNATVAAIDRQGVDLRGPSGVRRLVLLPGVGKTAATTATTLTSAMSGGGKETR